MKKKKKVRKKDGRKLRRRTGQQGHKTPSARPDVAWRQRSKTIKTEEKKKPSERVCCGARPHPWLCCASGTHCDNNFTSTTL